MHVGVGKERRQAMAAFALKSALAHMALQAGCIFKHDCRDVGGRRRTIDRASKAVANDLRQIADVIEMSVRERDGVELFRSNGERLVIERFDIARSLEETAV